MAATLLRVVIALAIALVWTIPVGVAIGTNRRLATVLQPVVQITASVPATALFPVLLLFVLRLPGGLNLAAVLLMLMGTQWYLLFNIIAGASAIPQDLKYTAALLGLSRLGALAHADPAGAVPLPGHRRDHGQRRRLERQHRGRIRDFRRAEPADHRHRRADRPWPRLPGIIPCCWPPRLSMILAVVLINRLVWRPLYRAGRRTVPHGVKPCDMNHETLLLQLKHISARCTAAANGASPRCRMST